MVTENVGHYIEKHISHIIKPVCTTHSEPSQDIHHPLSSPHYCSERVIWKLKVILFPLRGAIIIAHINTHGEESDNPSSEISKLLQSALRNTKAPVNEVFAEVQRQLSNHSIMTVIFHLDQAVFLCRELPVKYNTLV